jgi:hypothetical protein
MILLIMIHVAPSISTYQYLFELILKNYIEFFSFLKLYKYLYVRL